MCCRYRLSLSFNHKTSWLLKKKWTWTNHLDEGVVCVCVTHHNVDLKENVKYTHINRVRGSQMLIALLNMFQSINKSMQRQGDSLTGFIHCEIKLQMMCLHISIVNKLWSVSVQYFCTQNGYGKLCIIFLLDVHNQLPLLSHEAHTFS